VISLHKNGKTVIVEGANHQTISSDPAAISAVKDWITGLAAPPPPPPPVSPQT
jgi:hypothetical protein